MHPHRRLAGDGTNLTAHGFDPAIRRRGRRHRVLHRVQRLAGLYPGAMPGTRRRFHLRSRLLDGLLTGTVELHPAHTRRRHTRQPGHILGQADPVPQVAQAVAALPRFLEEVQQHRIGAHLFLLRLLAGRGGSRCTTCHHQRGSQRGLLGVAAIDLVFAAAQVAEVVLHVFVRILRHGPQRLRLVLAMLPKLLVHRVLRALAAFGQ